MILSLEDNNCTDCSRNIFDPRSGKTFSISNDGLSGRAQRQARRSARREVRAVRREQRTERKMNRATAKTQRQSTKQEKRQLRRDVGVEKQQKRMIRVKGKQDVIRARQESQKQKTQSTFQPQYQPDGADQIPNYDTVNGASFLPDSSDYYPQPQYVDTPYDEVNYDPNAPEENPAEYYYEEEQEDQEMFPDGELSAGFITSAIKGVGKLIQKASESKAGTAVKKITGTYQDYQNCKVQVQNLQYQLQAQKNSCLIKMIAAGGAGLLVGVLIRR